MDITFYLFFIALLVSFAAWCIFLWAIRTGQFHNVEEIKFQVWPGPGPGPGPEPGAGAGARDAAARASTDDTAGTAGAR